MAQIRRQSEFTLLLDTGDALVGGGTLGDITQGKAVVAGMSLMSYDAMAIGPKELSLGEKVLRQRAAEAEFPMLSANVTSGWRDQPTFEPYALIDVGDHRIGVIGLSRDRDARADSAVPFGAAAWATDTPEATEGFRISDPRAAAARLVPEVSLLADTIIVLTNMPHAEALRLADSVPGIDLVIAADPDRVQAQLDRAPTTGTRVVSADSPTPRHTGRRMGRLQATLDGQGSIVSSSWKSEWMDKDLADDPGMDRLLESFR